MHRSIKSDKFEERLDSNARFLFHEGGEEMAFRFYAAVEQTSAFILGDPDLGKLCLYRHPKLASLRFHPVERPFHKWLIFYRHDAAAVTFFSIEHGAQDLPSRLVE